jgi:hypothetical protein
MGLQSEIVMESVWVVQLLMNVMFVLVEIQEILLIQVMIVTEIVLAILFLINVVYVMVIVQVVQTAKEFLMVMQ